MEMLSKKRYINDNNSHKLKKIKTTETFLSKLHTILSNDSNKDIISWNEEGKKVIIKDMIKLCSTILPHYYNHNRYSSFVRQLNMYGFHKTKGLKKFDIYELKEFTKFATKKEIEQIKRIKREKIETNSTDTEELTKNENLDEIISFFSKKNDENEKKIQKMSEEIENLKENNAILNNQIERLKTAFDEQIKIFHKLENKMSSNCGSKINAEKRDNDDGLNISFRNEISSANLSLNPPFSSNFLYNC